MKSNKRADIQRQIKSDLINGVYSPGSKMNIAQLKEYYQVSLTPLREALSHLSAQGMLEQETNKGYRVPKLSYEDVLDIKNTRILVETQALRLSFAQGDVEWESNLVATYHKLKKLSLSLKDIDEWSAAHEKFHSILLSGSQSKYLIEFSIKLNLALDKYRRIAEPNNEIRELLDRQHKQLLDLALERNIDEATQVLTSHITLSCQSAIDLLKEKSNR